MFELVREPSSFKTPEEEIAYLRKQISNRERSLYMGRKEAGPDDVHAAGEDVVRTYAKRDATLTLAPEHQMPIEAVESAALEAHEAENKTAHVIEIARTKGVKNALSVLEKMNDAFLTDDVHRALVAEIRGGRSVANLKREAPLWKLLHMVLYEVSLPTQKTEEAQKKTLKELVSGMEQFYAGMQSVSNNAAHDHFAIEIAVSDKSDDIIFYVAVPRESVDLFEKQILGLFPNAVLTEQLNDYNIFARKATSLVSVARLRRPAAYPLKNYETFDHDPLTVLLNAFSKIERDGGGAALQIILRKGSDKHTDNYRKVIRRVSEGMKPEKALKMMTSGGELFQGFKDIFSSSKKHKEHEKDRPLDENALEQFEEKISSPILEANIRVAVSAPSTERARQILSEIESSFNQFENTRGNRIEWKRLSRGAQKKVLKYFSFREFEKGALLPLSTKELATLVHFPAPGVEVSPQFKQTHAKTAPAPLELPQEGTKLGINSYRGREVTVYLTPEDRLRHLYIIGQTGTGKTTLMKNMIVDDIEAGNGVCFIDPHGTDIADILAAIPPGREGDVIYFDPSRTDRVLGLNMLEFDPKRPEQKTFVVNELFSIFQKLYGKVPESMGPMFEQYFRNATLLVLEDPESGATLLDISRVMADAEFRAAKLAKATNPVVIEFWQKIATQAGGEAALENIIPYITSKFDIFTANDFMRPIIGQQKSSFDFRTAMDDRKIILVNLSKGRLGEINANLIGMIIVGKILMAALSRVDGSNYPPFYLHIDEFQNVTTDSIATILSEARKYKLGLTIAHQFIAQIDERIRDAVFGNVGSLAAFRVGAEDAEFLQKQLTPVFDAHDLMNIENRNAYVRLLARGVPQKPFDIHTLAPRTGDPTRAQAIIEASYERHAVPRRKVEMQIAARYQQ